MKRVLFAALAITLIGSAASARAQAPARPAPSQAQQAAWPRGGLWVAYVDGAGAGCAALREIDEETGEVKRMYVDPEMRGQGIARTLARHVIESAREIGYKRLRLGTLATMKPAQSLYESLGFRSVPAYRPNEFGDTLFYELFLDDANAL